MSKNNGHEDNSALTTTQDVLNQVMETTENMTASEGAISEGEKNSLGVLKKLISIEDKDDYMQILYLGKFLTFEQASKVAAAIEEAFRYDLSLRPILTWVVAQCGVSTNKSMSGLSRADMGVFGVVRRDINIPHYYDAKKGDPDNRKVSPLG